jgi:hypothetical protein
MDNEEQWDVAKSTVALALPILLVQTHLTMSAFESIS